MAGVGGAAALSAGLLGCHQPVPDGEPCGRESGHRRVARGRTTQVAIGTIVPGSGNPANGIVVAGDGIAKTNYTWPNLGFAPRFGVAYDVSGTQSMVVRGGFGMFFDRLERQHRLQPGGQSADRQSRPTSGTATCRRSGSRG